MANASITTDNTESSMMDDQVGEEMILFSRDSWLVPKGSARNVDELSFTSRDKEGRICWWDVTPPKTNYWPVHYALGRAYAFELLDLIHNDNKDEDLEEQFFGFIASEIVRKGRTMSDGLYSGFFGVISEYLVTGSVNR